MGTRPGKVGREVTRVREGRTEEETNFKKKKKHSGTKG